MRFLWGLLALPMVSCATSVEDSAPVVDRPVPVVAAPTVTEPTLDEEAFFAILDAAERALADDRLLTPEHDSAYGYYQEALAMAPDHPLAREGFERIVERYLDLANRAIERERWATARSMLDRAAIVDATHPGIESLRRQVALLATAQREVLTLVQASVRRRDAATASRLAVFGRKARRADARVTIRAGSDADGRWIYEQLNKAPGDRRIRASLAVGVPPRVTVLFLDGGE